MKLAFIGPPLSGKGSQAKLFLRRLEIDHISTGDLFREAIKANRPIGLEAKKYMDAGQLVPDEITIGILKARLEQQAPNKGFILDGFPRTLSQAKALDAIVKLDKVVLFDLSRQALEERLSGRMSCPKCGTPYHVVTLKPQKEGICDHCETNLVHRDDDNIASFIVRLEAFYKETKPVIEHYRNSGMLFEVDSGIGLENLYAAIIRAAK